MLKENVEKGNFLPSYKLLDDVDEPLPPAEGGDGEDHHHLHQGEGAGMQGQQYQYILSSKAVLRSRSRGFFSWSRSQYFGSALALNLFFFKDISVFGTKYRFNEAFFI